MSRKHGGGHEEEGGHGGDRPWVFFMVDCFFLITMFFVMTFRVKADEIALPQRLPPGGSKPSTTSVADTKKKLSIHVSGTADAKYEFMSKGTNLSGLQDMLAGSTGGGQEYQVQVSYDAEVPFRHVMAVFNACNKAKIAECGLRPLRR